MRGCAAVGGVPGGLIGAGEGLGSHDAEQVQAGGVLGAGFGGEHDDVHFGVGCGEDVAVYGDGAGERVVDGLAHGTVLCDVAAVPQPREVLVLLSERPAHLGEVTTDLNGNRGHQSVAEGAGIIVKMATIGAHGPTGTFADRNGTMPW
jgi:hypothetical protein